MARSDRRRGRGCLPACPGRDTGRAMSQENVERLLEVYDLFPELKAGDIDPLLEYFGADVVIETVDAPDPETYVGHDGVHKWLNDVYGVWSPFTSRPTALSSPGIGRSRS